MASSRYLETGTLVFLESPCNSSHKRISTVVETYFRVLSLAVLATISSSLLERKRGDGSRASFPWFIKFFAGNTITIQ
jgi:uncharacterized membrane protein YadS